MTISSRMRKAPRPTEREAQRQTHKEPLPAIPRAAAPSFISAAAGADAHMARLPFEPLGKGGMRALRPTGDTFARQGIGREIRRHPRRLRLMDRLLKSSSAQCVPHRFRPRKGRDCNPAKMGEAEAARPPFRLPAHGRKRRRNWRGGGAYPGRYI